VAQNPNFNELATTTLNLWVSKNFANVFTGHNPLFYLLRKNGNVQTGGLGIKALEPLMYADPGGPQVEGVADPYTELTPEETLGWTNAEYNWCEKRLSVSIPELTMDQQGSETMKINHLNTVKDISVNKFLENLAFDLWRAEGAVGTNGNSRQYLGSILTYLNRGGTLTTNTVFTYILGEQTFSGINGGAAVGTTPVTNVGNLERNGANGAFWCTPVFNPAANQTMSLEAMNYGYNLAVRDKDMPDLIVMNRQGYGSFMSILQGFQRFDKGGLADAGFDSMKFRGADIVMDDRCPAHTVLFINTKYLKLRCASMAPKFELKPDPHRTITNWNARWVGQITSGHLGRVHSRCGNLGV
jgi:hypothetical protein